MRMNNSIREQIIGNAVKKAGFPERAEAIRQRRAAWAEAVRIDSLGGAEAAEAIEKLQDELNEIYQHIPKNLRKESLRLRTDYEIDYLNIAGLSYRMKFNGCQGCNGVEPIYRICPNEHVLLADNPLTAEFHELHALQEQYNSELDNLRQSVRAAVESVTTTEKLLKLWPEAAELLPTEVAPKHLLPALPVVDLNKMIGLPSNERNN